eukprot:g64404.t1
MGWTLGSTSMEPSSQAKTIADLQQQAMELQTVVDQSRQLMRQLAEEKAKAELADRHKTTFLATVCDEIRTPLSAMRRLAEMTKDDPSCSPAVAESLEVILSSGRAMSELVGELLDVSKMETEGLQVDVQKFSVKQVVREVFEMMKVFANKKTIEFDVEIKHMPDSILSDPVRFRQILINMLSNAIKFTHEGKVSCLLRLQERSGAEAMLECFVRDTGIGITTEQAERLFAPFAQGDASITRRFGGTGLGLFLSRKLAQKLGGDLVLVESQPNQGSTFLCTLNAGTVEACQGEGVLFSSPKPVPSSLVQRHRKVQRLTPNQGFAKLHLDIMRARLSEQSEQSPPASPSMAHLSPTSSPAASPDMSYPSFSISPTGSDILSSFSADSDDSPSLLRRTLAKPSESGEQVGCVRKAAPLSGRARKRVRTD